MTLKIQELKSLNDIMKVACTYYMLDNTWIQVTILCRRQIIIYVIYVTDCANQTSKSFK